MLKMKNVLNRKLGNGGGFTLAELLVVVAIIAILVAVSIPIFTGKLQEARENTDKANLRAAKAEAVTYYLTDKENLSSPTYYDIEKGSLVSETEITAGYNKAQQKGTDGKAIKAGGGVIKVTYDPAKSEVKAVWEQK